MNLRLAKLGLLLNGTEDIYVCISFLLNLKYIAL